jgi:hypothetical protein
MILHKLPHPGFWPPGPISRLDCSAIPAPRWGQFRAWPLFAVLVLNLFNLILQLPSTQSMPAARTQRLETTMYAHILTPEVSSKLAHNEKDAALCALSRSAQHEQERYFWVSVDTTEVAEAGGAAQNLLESKIIILVFRTCRFRAPVNCSWYSCCLLSSAANCVELPIDKLPFLASYN